MPKSNNGMAVCNFCGKTHDEVRKLVAGPGVYICDKCIGVCKGILEKELQAESKAVASARMVARAKNRWRRMAPSSFGGLSERTGMRKAENRGREPPFPKSLTQAFDGDCKRRNGWCQTK